jgi:hypothetical protein
MNYAEWRHGLTRMYRAAPRPNSAGWLKAQPFCAQFKLSGLSWGFRRSRTLNPGGIRTAFRDDPEHHRSVATLAPRLCKKCSASSRETYPKRSEGRMPLAEKGARGKGRQPLSPPQLTVTRSAMSVPDSKVTSGLPTILALSEHHISNDLLTREFRH